MGTGVEWWEGFADRRLRRDYESYTMAFRLSWLEILLLKLVSRPWLVGRPDSVVGNSEIMLAGNGHIHASRSVKVEITRKRRPRDLVMMVMAKTKWWRPGCRYERDEYARDDGLTTGYGERETIRWLKPRTAARLGFRTRGFRHDYSWRHVFLPMTGYLCSRGLHRHIHEY